MSDPIKIAVALPTVPALYLKKILEHCQPITTDGNDLERRFPSNGVSLVSIGKEMGLVLPEIPLYALSQCGILKLVPSSGSQKGSSIEIPLTYLSQLDQPAVYSLTEVEITHVEFGSFNLGDYFTSQYKANYIAEKLPMIIRFLKEQMSKKDGGWFDPKGKLVTCIRDACGVNELFAKSAIIYFRDMWVLEEDGRKLGRHHFRRFPASIYSEENSVMSLPIDYFGDLSLAQTFTDEAIASAYKQVRNWYDEVRELRRKADAIENKIPSVVANALEVHKGNVARANLLKELAK